MRSLDPATEDDSTCRIKSGHTNLHLNPNEITKRLQVIRMDRKRSTIVISCSFLCFEQEGEGLMECGGQEHLQESAHPEEFVAIADYSATDQTQVTRRTCSRAVAMGLGPCFFFLIQYAK